ncbi:Yqey-like protein-domain-containing protein [Pseudomassariella vexata]|uniref:Altered inheritance of mitochondria protein 41 n=1 Tax=Pseudomassariella vexata TaxID=1141098 RepID=A0A1Y2DV22_9PEZI|nr:Yqey-like protein-domain-containing protein [Pseudomassariella vexata]ORY63121.1 Yqey-like protein-domain-containing protein [Pseudomassariella vexata]
MAFQPTRRMAPSLLRARLASAAPRNSPLVRLYSSSTETPAPPMLQKLKADLKTAMRAKDAPRLMVLRSILSSTLNASKTANPIQTDVQLVALLRKTVRASEDASAEFKGAGRDDLVEKEQAQIDVLKEYVAGSGVQEVSAEDLKALTMGVVTAMTDDGMVQGKAKMGEVMKKLMAPGGPLDGKVFEKADLAKVVKEVVG